MPIFKWLAIMFVKMRGCRDHGCLCICEATARVTRGTTQSSDAKQRHGGSASHGHTSPSLSRSSLSNSTNSTISFPSVLGA